MVRTVFLFGAGASMPLPGQRDLLKALAKDTNHRVLPARRYLEMVFPGAVNGDPGATLEDMVGPLEIAESEEYWFHLAGRARRRLLTNRDVLKSIDSWIARALDPPFLPRFPKRDDAEYDAKASAYHSYYGGTSGVTYAELLRQVEGAGLTNEAQFISLNYDLLLDRVLLAHGFEPDYRVDAFADDGERNRDGRPIPTIKLHGSLNWRICDSCHYLRNLRTASIWPGSRCKDCDSDEARPMLIRPTFLKEFRHRVWQGLWRDAGHLLADADHWIVIGYSLPLADVWVLRVLAQSARSNRHGRPPRITVVNPDHSAIGRFRLMFPGAEGVESTFGDWLAGTPF